MPAQHFNQESDLIAALRSYTQADADGVMVKVSRQACDEAAERIAQLERDLADAQGIIGTYRKDYSDLMTENRRVVDERDQARTELAAAQESYRNCVKDYNTVVDDNTQLRVDLAAANTRADAMLRVAEKHEAEAAALRVLLREARGRLSTNSYWKAGEFPSLADRIDAAIDAARGDGNG